ncbi:MAG: glycerophosphodiester phosphodiesterase [Peptostreptococcus sp.]|uniref:glycerophosphodiester phosphodiesterase n=1 Tax=Peptostreptococcus TaxID=1257 RepID=UPI000767CD47|nr:MULTISPECIES: glycerophosphodiester phosphodiesterase [Peptostreptococcus]KXB73305.1 glycerophosphodiester phosphodiesterase family protein [Peptostreptococcus anaerobius]MCB6982352.1 glycerophosphodiester phosphodiesterase [Peptostreptococcus anaerobius]MCQ5150121.1 glycerophosphodiester phosphodiesterase [Peptostreptococcus anaerobius]MDU1265255.1 glycerophosphodiester phosphodiesterase [Peptostreptococcus sp.]
MEEGVFRILSRTWRSIYRNKFDYLINASVLQLIMTSIGTYLLSEIFNLVLASSRQTNINMDNIGVLVKNPISLVMVAVYLLFFALLITIEFSVMCMMVYGKQNNKYYSIKSALLIASKRFKGLIGVSFIFFIGYLLVTIPTANTGMMSILTEKLYIPKFITDEILKMGWGRFFIPMISLVFIYINFRLIFSIPILLIKGKDFRTCLFESWKLTRKKKLKLATTMVLFEVPLSLANLLFYAGIVTVLSMVDPQGKDLVSEAIFLSATKLGIFFFLVMTKIGILEIIISIISGGQDLSEDIDTISQEERKKSKLLISSLVVVSISSIVVNGFRLSLWDINKDMKTIAHRGCVGYGAENSIEALEGAKRVGVDYAEMDVQMTKDHKFVVVHDFNLKRLTGKKLYVKDMYYKDIVGMKIRDQGFTGNIVSFEEYVKKAKELNIKLLVELKPNGGEPKNYADLFIKEVDRLGIRKEYKYMSLSKSLMEEINKKAPEMETGHVIPLQIGGFSDEDVDFFVIEDFSYRNRYVEEAKLMGKDVYVWTINDEGKMNQYLQRPVDGIITDEASIFLNIKRDYMKNNTYFDRLARIIEAS